jgi:ubiquinone/menaquinone biosynthesis C-methylase UbiE
LPSASPKPASTPLAKEPAMALAALCKAAGDPLRLDIMRVLSKDTFGVLELARIFEMPQPGMSHHLKILANAGLLAPRRQGNNVFYRRALRAAEGELSHLQHGLYAAIDALPLAPEYERRMAKIHAERAESSRSFFAKNAAEFGDKQGRLVSLGQYLPNLKELLDVAALPRRSRVMEVGPGEGELLSELAARYDHVIALDDSKPMLARAQVKGKAKDEKITFVHGALEDFEPGDAPLDGVVLNMVLHHLSSPAKIFQKLRKIIRQGGCLLIADLGPHNQEWTRKSCGDVWLGFDPEDLSDWATTAGFGEEHALYLGLKNGFQIQLKLFR